MQNQIENSRSLRTAAALAFEYGERNVEPHRSEPYRQTAGAVLAGLGVALQRLYNAQLVLGIHARLDLDFAFKSTRGLC